MREFYELINEYPGTTVLLVIVLLSVRISFFSAHYNNKD